MSCPAKQCRGCGEYKPASLEYFHTSSKSHGDGLRGYCKPCWLARQRERARNNPASVRAASRRWRQRHPEQHKAIIARRPKRKPTDRIRALARASRERCRGTPHYKLNARMRSRIRAALRGQKGGRSWVSLVGYRPEDLRAHLERQFTKGMGWHNMGEWHIDHIVPLAHFDAASPSGEGFKLAWALTNLRPLWKKENQQKHRKRLHLL